MDILEYLGYGAECTRNTYSTWEQILSNKRMKQQKKDYEQVLREMTKEEIEDEFWNRLFCKWNGGSDNKIIIKNFTIKELLDIGERTTHKNYNPHFIFDDVYAIKGEKYCQRDKIGYEFLKIFHELEDIARDKIFVEVIKCLK